MNDHLTNNLPENKAYFKTNLRCERDIDWSNKKILFVEDDEISRILLEEYLIPSGVKIIHAIDGKEAIEEFHKHRSFDLVILDIRLPQIDGITVFKYLQEISPMIPVIAQTAYGTTDIKDRCMDAGFSEFMLKPIMQESLYATLSKYLN